MNAKARAWQEQWAPDIAMAMLIAASIAAFHGRYLIADRFTLDRNDVFDTTLWLAFIIAMLGCGRVVYRLAMHARKRRKRYQTNLRDDDTGSLSIEFLLTFPWMYIMFGMVIQWGLIARAKIIVDYAAYRAARSAITQVETETLGPLYSIFAFPPEDIPDVRKDRVREAAALILAQLSPYHTSDATNRGAWDDYGYGSGRTAAMAMAEAGIPRWPYAMKTDAYEKRASWALQELQAGQQGGSGFVLNAELAPLMDFNASQFADVAGNAVSELKRMIEEDYLSVLTDLMGGQEDASPDQSGSWGFTIPMPWPIPDINIGVSDGDNSNILTDMLGLPNLQDLINDFVSDMLNSVTGPIERDILGPMEDAMDGLDAQAAATDPGNPLIPRQARVQIKYPYQLRVPLVAALVHPLWETKSGFTGRFIQIESDVALQSTGGRAGNLLTLLGGTPIP